MYTKHDNLSSYFLPSSKTAIEYYLFLVLHHFALSEREIFLLFCHFGRTLERILVVLV